MVFWQIFPNRPWNSCSIFKMQLLTRTERTDYIAPILKGKLYPKSKFRPVFSLSELCLILSAVAQMPLEETSLSLSLGTPPPDHIKPIICRFLNHIWKQNKQINNNKKKNNRRRNGDLEVGCLNLCLQMIHLSLYTDFPSAAELITKHCCLIINQYMEWDWINQRNVQWISSCQASQVTWEWLVSGAQC